jgi:hypothetical protein
MFAVSMARRRLRDQILTKICHPVRRRTHCRDSKSIPAAISTLGDTSGCREESTPSVSCCPSSCDSSSLTDACVVTATQVSGINQLRKLRALTRCICLKRVWSRTVRLPLDYHYPPFTKACWRDCLFKVP